MTNNEREQKERREVLENDRKVRNTFLSHAESAADQDQGGRFAKRNPVSVTGTTSVPIFPTQPASSPWKEDTVPTEPPLGFCVNDQPVVGGPVDEVVAAPPADEALVRQPFVRRRVKR